MHKTDKTEVLSYHMSGNSFPVVIRRNNKKFLVKLRAGLSGQYSLLNEWLGNRIGRSIGLNCRLPHWIRLTEETECHGIYIEVRELIEKSTGINIGFDYIENAEIFEMNQFHKINKKTRCEIFLLDVLMRNIDRSAQNHNLLADKSGLLVTDFESSLIFNELLNKANLSNNLQVLQCLKANPFWQKVDDSQLKSFLSKINLIDFREIIYTIPNELITDRDKEKLYKEVEKKKAKDWDLPPLLHKLENTELETERDRKLRTLKNREKLENLVRTTNKR